MKRSARFGTLILACVIGTAAQAQNSQGRLAASPKPLIAFAPETLLTGATPVASGATSQLRFVSLGKSAGTATVALYDASSGKQLATWTSASMPALGYLQVDVSTIIAGATPALTPSQSAAALQFGVKGTFIGSVQSVVVANGIASDLTSCEAGAVFGGVAGAGHTTLMSGLEFTNRMTTAQAATVTLRSATGTTLGTWTSASIPPHGVLTVSGGAIAAAAIPAVPLSTVSFTAVAGGRGISVRHLSQPKAGGLVTNLSSACHIAPVPVARTSRTAADPAEAGDDGLRDN